MKTIIACLLLSLGLAPAARAEEPVPSTTACVCTCGQAVQEGRDAALGRFLQALREGRLTRPGLVTEQAGEPNETRQDPIRLTRTN